MKSESARAARYGHSGDPRIEQLPSRLDHSNISTLPAVQAHWIGRRFGLTLRLAALVRRPPSEGAVGAFAFGRSRGVVEGVCGTLDHAACSEAIRRWPHKAALFARVKDDGRAEAALIAVAGLAREARHV